LLHHNADVNAKDIKGNTALLYAAADGRSDVVQLLLDHNADVSVVEPKWKRSALVAAILGGMQWFQEYFLMHSNHNDYLSVNEDQLLIVRLLLKQMDLTDKRLIDHQDDEGYTALHFAAREGSALIAQEILNWKPNVFLQSYSTQETALHCSFSSRLSQSEKVKRLFGYANVYSNEDHHSLQDQYGHEGVQSAVACSGDHSLIEYLSSVVDVRIRDVNGNTALHIAVQKGLSQ